MPRTHTVVEGDTLGKIAVKYLGVWDYWLKIRDANPQLAKRPRVEVDNSPVIYPGDVLIIPDDEIEPPEPVLPKNATKLDKNAPADITIEINGKAFTGFTGYTISMPVDGFDAFSFSAPFDDTLKNVKEVMKPFSYPKVKVFYGRSLLFSGTLLTADAEVSPDSRTVNIQGYPLCGVLQDACLPESKYPPEWNGLKLSEIASDCCKPFGVKVSVDGDEGEAFEKVEYSQGETIFAFLKKLAEQRDLILGNKKDGSLLIWKPATQKVAVTIEEGKLPFLSCKPKFDAQNFFSHVTGYSKTGNEEDAASFTYENSYLTKMGILRPFSFVAQDAKATEIEAATKAKAAAMFGSAVSYDLTVVGHEMKKDTLWQKNTAVSLKSEGAMIYRPFTLLVDKVDIKRSGEDGNVTSLSLVLPGARDGTLPTRFPWE